MIIDDLDALEYWLVLWGRSMRVDTNRSKLGYPSRACGMGLADARIQSFDDLETEVDQWGVRVVDAVLRDVQRGLVKGVPDGAYIVLCAVYADPKGIRSLGDGSDLMTVDAVVSQTQEAIRPILRKKGLAV